MRRESRQVHKTARNKPRHVSSIYGVMGRGVWQPYVSHHQPQKSADLTMQSGALYKSNYLARVKTERGVQFIARDP